MSSSVYHQVKDVEEQIHASCTIDASRISLPGIIETIASFLPPNEIACTVRLVNKALLATFRVFVIVRLSQPVPAHAFAWRWACRNSMSSFSLSQRRDLLFLTATSGCLPNLKIVAASAGIVLQAKPRPVKGSSNKLISTVLEAAAAAGCLEICEWLRERGCPWAGSLAAAAGAGQVATCEWLLASGCPCDRAAVYAAARGGHVGLMEALRRRHTCGSSLPLPRDAVRVSGLLAAAAEGCDLATLQRLHADSLGPELPSPGQDGAAPPPQGRNPQLPAAAALQREPIPLPQQLLAVDKASILLAAVSSPTADWREKVEWLETVLGCSAAAGRPGASGAAAACAKAALRPDALERVAWLHARGYPLSTAVVAAAGAAGNLPLLEYLLAQGLRPAAAAASAAAAGHLAFLQALDARRCPVPWHVMQGAAEGGHLAVVAWVMAKDDCNALNGRTCIWGHTVLGAARSGSAALMGWLLEHRGRWDLTDEGPLFRQAVEGGCGEMLRLLVARGCSMEDNGDPYYVAAVNGDLATLSCLRELGCPWGAPGEVFGVCVADGDCPVPVLAWLLQEGCPVGCWEAALAAAARRTGPDREEVRTWLQREAVQRDLAVVDS
ncbi:hypothetical protein PLESTB_000890200 [Pleodorina starrii]|uniref:Ankyrin repeat domain-containing protein n=1 Tax=Pleodorina starrii TaxID=330485 RepID=A0A9W6BKN2_9CHLO|nr:hypothetical protein PLESTB_000806800 [Pleodorina starrii]GLC54637.1 hypothetical protein PLESTB_000890200 [Pleodorina starrii]GLC77010.1 hypothetical protein PLESTF_001873400 [Pleodorina starrii]